jgi:hypothetical protein
MPATSRAYVTTVAEPLPIWMAALLASACEARGDGITRDVQWECIDDRAIYTNDGEQTLILYPFGVPVRGGETLVVAWLPNETGYTVKLERNRVAA